MHVINYKKLKKKSFLVFFPPEILKQFFFKFTLL